MSRWTIETHSEPIEVTSNLPKPDPSWRHTDTHGHVHTYGPDFTLTWVETYTPEEPGAVYFDADGDEWIDEPEGHHVCAQCGERVHPGTYISPFREYIQGPIEVTITGRLGNQRVRLVPREDPADVLAALGAAQRSEFDSIIDEYVRDHWDWAEVTAVYG